MVEDNHNSVAGSLRDSARPVKPTPDATPSGERLATTPGPWWARQHPAAPQRWFVQAEDEYGGFDICELFNANRIGNARLIAAAPEMYEALQRIADESVFNQPRFAEDEDADYFLRCFRAVKECARTALAKATDHA